MTMANLPVGTRVYNAGDIANQPHFGTITAHIPGGRFPDHVEITPDEGTDRGPYQVPASMFDTKYLGHCGTRFVTESAYMAWRNEKLAELAALRSK